MLNFGAERTCMHCDFANLVYYLQIKNNPAVKVAGA